MEKALGFVAGLVERIFSGVELGAALRAALGDGLQALEEAIHHQASGAQMMR